MIPGRSDGAPGRRAGPACFRPRPSSAPSRGRLPSSRGQVHPRQQGTDGSGRGGPRNPAGLLAGNCWGTRGKPPGYFVCRRVTRSVTIPETSLLPSPKHRHADPEPSPKHRYFLRPLPSSSAAAPTPPGRGGRVMPGVTTLRVDSAAALSAAEDDRTGLVTHGEPDPAPRSRRKGGPPRLGRRTTCSSRPPAGA